MNGYDDPATLARLVGSCPRPILVGLDVDGVLAPIVDHADNARLMDGVGEAVTDLAGLAGIHVAVVSGRSLADLGRFGFGVDVALVGSHGMEASDRSMAPLSLDERERLDTLAELAEAAARSAGTGAWVERKPASVVLHIRQAHEDHGRAALGQLALDAAGVEEATSKVGSGVLELFTRAADKGTAIMQLHERFGAATTVFVGDDKTDEEAFARLGPGDHAVKVGDGDTAADHRLRDPAAVLEWIVSLREQLTAR